MVSENLPILTVSVPCVKRNHALAIALCTFCRLHCPSAAVLKVPALKIVLSQCCDSSSRQCCSSTIGAHFGVLAAEPVGAVLFRSPLFPGSELLGEGAVAAMAATWLWVSPQFQRLWRACQALEPACMFCQLLIKGSLCRSPPGTAVAFGALLHPLLAN